MDMLMRKFSAVTLITLLFPLAGFASEDGGAAGGFLFAGGSGARSAGLANSCVADSSDASGGYFNPALVTTVKNTELTFYYTSPMGDVNYDVISFALPVLEYGMLSFSRVELATEGVERITAEGIKTGDFSDKSEAYLLTYGYPFTDSLSAGLTVKMITRSFDTMNASGFGLDAGITYNFGGIFNASLAFLNITQPSIKIGSVAELYPMNMRLGGALYILDSHIALTGGLLLVNILADGRDFTDYNGKIIPRGAGGVEFRPFDFVAIRGGFSQDGPAAGAGITTENFTLDYAATFSVIGLVHNFGVTARFGIVPTEREKKLEMEKKKLAGEKEKLTEGITNMSYSQLYLSALNSYNTGNIDKADSEIKELQKNKNNDPNIDKLASDIRVALNRRAAGVKFDAAVAELAKGKKDSGLAMIREAEKSFPGITDAKIKEYMDKGAKNIEDRRFMDAKQWYENILAVDPSNAKAAEMLGKIQDLSNMTR